jgi:hypothetical protein
LNDSRILEVKNKTRRVGVACTVNTFIDVYQNSDNIWVSVKIEEMVDAMNNFVLESTISFHFSHSSSHPFGACRTSYCLEGKLTLSRSQKHDSYVFDRSYPTCFILHKIHKGKPPLSKHLQYVN